MMSEEQFIRKFGQNSCLMRMLKIYKKIYCFFFGLKKEMPLSKKITFSFRNKVKKIGRNNVIKLNTACVCKHNYFYLSGNNNQIIVGTGSQISHVTFELCGGNNRILIGDNVTLRDSTIHFGDGGSLLSIGNDTKIGKGLRMSIYESANIDIGSDCLLSTNISIMNSDAHSIINLNNNHRTNKAMDVSIGNHVWLGEDVTVLKGAKIQDNVVVGTKSMLFKGIYEGNSIYIGIPARLLVGGG